LKIHVLVKWVYGVIFDLRIQRASGWKETTLYRRRHKYSPSERAVRQNSPSFRQYTYNNHKHCLLSLLDNDGTRRQALGRVAGKTLNKTRII